MVVSFSALSRSFSFMSLSLPIQVLQKAHSLTTILTLLVHFYLIIAAAVLDLENFSRVTNLCFLRYCPRAYIFSYCKAINQSALWITFTPFFSRMKETKRYIFWHLFNAGPEWSMFSFEAVFLGPINGCNLVQHHLDMALDTEEKKKRKWWGSLSI